MKDAARHLSVAWLFLLVSSFVAACSSSPPPPGVIQLSLKASADINPDAGGQAAPVVVRVYHLAATGKFSMADFFSLYNNDKATLGPDLVSRQDVTLMPGQSQTLSTPLEPAAHDVGVLAAFRDIDHASWRGIIAVPPNGTTKLQANVTRLQIQLTKAPSS